MKWILAEVEPAKAAALSAALRISLPAARVLCARGLSDPAAARRFLEPSAADLHDPFLLADMAEGGGEAGAGHRAQRADPALWRLRRRWHQRASRAEEGPRPGGRERHLLRPAPHSRRLWDEKRGGGRRRCARREADRERRYRHPREPGSEARRRTGHRRHRDRSSLAGSRTAAGAGRAESQPSRLHVSRRKTYAARAWR